jgi:hypothetical protein
VLARLAAGMLLAALVVAGCGSSGPTIPPSKLSKLVLQRSDLSKEFAAFYFGRELSSDQPGFRPDPQRFGRLGGWIGRYHRAGTAKTAGPLVVVSRADLFKRSSGAKSELALYRNELAKSPAAKVEVGKLGDEAFGVTTLRPGAVSVRSYAIAWRDANASALLELNGFAGNLTLADALVFARRQEQHLRAALR